MNSFSSAIRYLVCLSVGAALIAATYGSLRLAWADALYRRDTEEAVTRAVEIAPGCAEYSARLAALRENAGRGSHEVEAALRNALTANPRASGVWIGLGLLAEANGDPAHAEGFLMRAAKIDRMYSAQWTLANFYFRRGQPEKFWPAARRALRIGDVEAHNPAPLFDLCWNMSQDPATILERAIPDLGAVQARYLEFLVERGRVRVAEPVTVRVIAYSSDQDLAAVFRYCDRLIEAGDVDRAIHAWNALCWRTLHQYRPLNPGAGVSLTNGNFASAPLEHGFDWRVGSIEGVTTEFGGTDGRVWVSFNGRQPENCEPLAQFVPLAPSRKYRLRFRYQTDRIPAGSGLRWRIWDAVAKNEIASDTSDLTSEEESERVIRFTTAETHLARLALDYDRAPGSSRIEGHVSLGQVTLSFEP